MLLSLRGRTLRVGGQLLHATRLWKILLLARPPLVRKRGADAALGDANVEKRSRFESTSRLFGGMLVQGEGLDLDTPQPRALLKVTPKAGATLPRKDTAVVDLEDSPEIRSILET